MSDADPTLCLTALQVSLIVLASLWAGALGFAAAIIYIKTFRKLIEYEQPAENAPSPSSEAGQETGN